VEIQADQRSNRDSQNCDDLKWKNGSGKYRPGANAVVATRMMELHSIDNIASTAGDAKTIWTIKFRQQHLYTLTKESPRRPTTNVSFISDLEVRKEQP
jgi:hypothetical protein